jgi:hypothetical protein
MKYSDDNIREWLSNFKSREIITLECDHCDKIYNINKHSVLRSFRKNLTHSFCSNQCRNLFNNIFTEYICVECNKSFINYTKVKSKFCSHSCSASYNNAGVTRNGTPPPDCKNCGKKTKRNSSKYCSSHCNHDFNLNKKITSGKFSAITGKRWLLKSNGNICSICNLSEWNDRPIPIEIDHIDGNSENNSLKNLRLICPNCHAQTNTYKNKNKGNGRYKRMQRYKEGKSY